MNPEVVAAYIAGGGALFGVVLGIAGTLAAARIQARAAYAQADAAVEAARAQARATYASTLHQHNQVARGATYARLVDAGHSFIRALANLARIDEGTADEPLALTAPYTELHRAESAVKVWAPQHVRDAANELTTNAWRITIRITKHNRHMYEGWHALYAAAAPLREMPRRNADEPLLATAFVAGAAVRAHRRHVDAYHRDGRSSTPLIAEERRVWEETAGAMEAAFSEAVTAGILTEGQARALASEGASTATPPREELFNRVGQMDDLLDEFAEQARLDLGYLPESFEEE
ncbi:hypothetical protein RM550_14735 [Streptomyces sp. DSM 41527]|uniref:Uncharacterized protein n=1 Tax=Streptomyces mooreae TaxID=3075523 RepID=A0ABU2T6X9_9ACTN|nr:hypothetical protein [Streptomyces sp. DSM 41527]MDT0456977.1 hypothetical protein [Streptomyces sp. DSM 41527]